MASIDLRSAVIAGGAVLAGFGGWAVTGSLAPIGVGACVASGGVGVRALTRRRRTPRVVEQPSLDVAGPVNGDTGQQDELVAALARDLARSERYHDPLTLCLVRLQDYDRLSNTVREMVDSHLSATVERVTRASDSWYQLGDGRIAVILERCNAQEAAFFGERLSIAVNSRPVIAGGARVSMEIGMSYTQYDPNQFVGAQDFLAAASAARLVAPGRRERLVADGRFLRQNIYGRDRTAGAA